MPVSCLRKLVSPPSELSGFLATQSKYSFSLKQDHQRWRYVIVNHLTIWFHMKRFVQSGWLDQSDGEDGCLCLCLRCAFGQFWSILSNLCQSWSILPVWVLKFGKIVKFGKNCDILWKLWISVQILQLTQYIEKYKILFRNERTLFATKSWHKSAVSSNH